MAAVTPQIVIPSGIVPVFSAVGLTDVISGAGVNGNERLWLHVKNGGGSAVTVTIAPVSPTSARVAGVGSLAVLSMTRSVPASGEAVIGPISQAYIDGTGNVTVTYSATTSVTAAAFSLPSVSY